MALVGGTRKRSRYFGNTSPEKKLCQSLEFEKKHDVEFSRLGREFFHKYSTVDLAKSLLGKYLCHRVEGVVVKGRIVESEAYLGAEDHASYSFGGRRTEANEPMYMSAGTCFVRLTYGMYFCFNLSSRDEGGAVLLRAAEPVEGIDKMCELRSRHPKAPSKASFVSKPFQLANGPSKLCIAFHIDRSTNKLDITSDPSVWLEDGSPVEESEIVETTRIGISTANAWANKMLRFYVKNSKSVSKR